MSYGFMRHDLSIPREPSTFGVDLRTDLETRWEEFALARDVLKGFDAPGRVVDLGCGFERRCHVMPEISAGMGWKVDAIDLEVGDFDPHPRIMRHVGDMCETPFEDASFDAALCISTAEHIDGEARKRLYAEMLRLTRPGGMIVITMDGVWPRRFPGVDWGDPHVPNAEELLLNNLGWFVSFQIGRREG